MKNVIMICMLMAGMAATIQADAKHNYGRRGKDKISAERYAARKTDRIDRVVGLSPHQRKAIYKTNLKAAKSRQAVVRHARENKMRMYETYRQRDAELKRILSPHQYRKYAPLSKEWKQHRDIRQHNEHRKGRLQNGMMPMRGAEREDRTRG